MLGGIRLVCRDKLDQRRVTLEIDRPAWPTHARRLWFHCLDRGYRAGDRIVNAARRVKCRRM